MKIKILIITILCINSIVEAQVFWEDKSIINTQKTQINKPSISGLNAFNISDDNVNLSTGVVSPSILLTDLSTKFLNDKVVLSYKNGNGIKVNDIASDVGLGWEIQTGGYISRKVNGFADESQIYTDASVGVEGNNQSLQPNGEKFINGWLDFANWKPLLNPQIPYLFPGTPSNNETLGTAVQRFSTEVINNNYSNNWFRYLFAQSAFGLGGYGGNASLGGGVTAADLGAMSGMGWDLLNVDGEPDEFYFNFGKYSGKFVFASNKEPVTIPFVPGLKIETPFNSNHNSWVFTTPEGIKYYFNNTADYFEKLYTETNAAPYHDNWSGNTPNINEGISASEYVSKWFLSKVEDVNGNTIEYTYDQVPDLVYSDKAEIKQVFRPSAGSTNNPPSYFVGSGDAGFYERILDRTTLIRLKSPKRISVIKTSDNNRVIFKYDGLIREDIDQSSNVNKRNSLAYIEKYDFNNKLIEKLHFDQSYFNSGCSNYDCKRLKLNNISKIKVNSDETFVTTNFEYFTDQNLPQRNSNQQDYWGYYNNNTANTLIPKTNNRNGYNYDGADKTPYENKTKANILKKIIYPTGGSIEYDYELNDFGVDYYPYPDFPITNNKTGGLRIKRIAKVESLNTLPIITSYDYKLTNGKTSGELPALLREATAWQNNNGAGKMLDRQKIEVDQNSGATSVYIMIYSNLMYLFTNDLIRYSRVVVNNSGKGTTEYTLSSFSSHPDDNKIGRQWNANNGGLIASPTNIHSTLYSSYSSFNRPTIFTPDKSYMRGLVLNKKEKDTSGNLIRETINNYSLNPDGYIPKIVYGIGTSSINTFIAESTQIKELNFELNYYNSDYVYLNSSETKDFYNNSQISTNQQNIFNSLGLLDTKRILYSNNETDEVISKYAHDKQNQKLINANVIGIPLEVETKKNGKTLNKTEIKYENISNIMPTSTSYYNKQTNSTEIEITYDLYDSKGNNIQFTSKDGIPTSIIWGYKSTEPIAIIKGATYVQIMQIFGLNANDNNAYLNLDIVKKSDLDIDDSSENLLLKELNIFRNKEELKNFEISTITYDPQIGVKSLTPASGIKENYIYDTTNRLEKLTDIDGNILKEYKYNYAPTLYYNSEKSQPFSTTNCGPGTQPQSATYIVQAGQYTSIISKDDANQKAQNDIDTNGQNWVNANFPCKPYSCSIDPAYNVSIYYSSFQETAANHIKGILSLPVSNSTNWSGTFIGTLGSLCAPNSYKNISVSSGDGSGTISIAPNGGVTVWISANSNSSSATFYFEYDK